MSLAFPCLPRRERCVNSQQIRNPNWLKIIGTNKTAFFRKVWWFQEGNYSILLIFNNKYICLPCFKHVSTVYLVITLCALCHHFLCTMSSVSVCFGCDLCTCLPLMSNMKLVLVHQITDHWPLPTKTMLIR